MIGIRGFTLILMGFTCAALSTCAQVSQNTSELSQTLEGSSWVLVKFDDQGGGDSIPQSDIYGKKLVEFSGDTLKEFYQPMNQPSMVMKYEIVSGEIRVQTDKSLTDNLSLSFSGDTLIISRRGRHGLMREYYVKKQSE